MRKSIVLSGVALSALMLGMAPAGAISLNIGGDGGLVSIDSGSSGSGDASGGSSGDGSGGSSGGSTDNTSTGGRLLNLNRPLLDISGDADADAAVEVDLGIGGGSDEGGSVLGSNGVVDLDTGGDDGVIVDLFGEEGAIADVELGVTGEGEGGLDLGGENGIATIDTDGQDGIILDLFGESGTVADVELPLGGGGDDIGGGEGLADVDTGGTDGINVDLLGEDAPLADVELGLDGDAGLLQRGAAARVGDDEVLAVNGDGGADVNVNLLDGSTDGPDATVALGDTNVAIDLFGPDVDETETGSVTPGNGGTGGAGGSGEAGGSGDVADTGDGDGDAGTGGSGTAGPGTVTPAPGGNGTVRPQPVRPAASGRVASVTTTGATSCFSPDQGQIAHLLGRNSYSAEVTAKFEEADTFKLVPINLCADAKARVEAALASDANIGALHSAIAADAEITAALEPSYSPEDVLAADQSGEDLTVYVY